MSRDSAKSYRIGLIGARGFVGSELIRLIQGHPNLSLAYVCSRERDSLLLADFEPTAPAGMQYVNFDPVQALQGFWQGARFDRMTLAEIVAA